MAPVKHMCDGCDKVIKENSSRIRCIQCKEWFHKKCSGLEKEAFNNLAQEFEQSHQNQWSCDKCDLEISIVNVDSDEEDSMDDDSEPPSRKMIMECMESILSELRIIRENIVVKKEIQISTSFKEDVKLHKTKNTLKLARHNENIRKMDEDRKVGTVDLYKKVGGVLNKLTPQKFSTLLNQMKALPIDTIERLQGVVELVYEKAVDNPNFSVGYALLCRELALMQVPVSAKSKEFVNFRKLLVTRCQIEFEKNSSEESNRNVRLAEIAACTDPEKKKELNQNLDEEDRRIRQKSVGNIRFIGELFKQEMLTKNIMVRCLHHLMENDDEERLECLCKLLSTIGKDLEQRNVDLSKIFDQMHSLLECENRKVNSRVHIMLQDVIDLRRGGWVPRRTDLNPKTIEQIQKEADNEHLNIAAMNSGPMTPRKDDRNSSNSGKRGGGCPNDDGWLPVPSSRGSKNTFTLQTDSEQIQKKADNVKDDRNSGKSGKGDELKIQQPTVDAPPGSSKSKC